MMSHHIWNIIVSLMSRMFPRLFKTQGSPPNKLASPKGVQLGHGSTRKRQKIHRFSWFPTYALEILFWLAKFVSEVSPTISWQKSSRPAWCVWLHKKMIYDSLIWSTASKFWAKFGKDWNSTQKLRCLQTNLTPFNSDGYGFDLMEDREEGICIRDPP